MAGASSSLISTPSEHFRIKMQVQGKIDPRGDPHYRSDLHCITRVLKDHGVVGAYRGLPITMAREVVTFGSYFGFYEYIVNNFLIPTGGSKSDVPAWKLFMTGGLCGYVYWGPWYPIDAVKSKLQADSFVRPRYRGVLDCVKQTFASEGVGGFYKGFLPCILRAFPANGATFLAFELTMRALNKGK